MLLWHLLSSFFYGCFFANKSKQFLFPFVLLNDKGNHHKRNTDHHYHTRKTCISSS